MHSCGYYLYVCIDVVVNYIILPYLCIVRVSCCTLTLCYSELLASYLSCFHLCTLHDYDVVAIGISLSKWLKISTLHDQQAENDGNAYFNQGCSEGEGGRAPIKLLVALQLWESGNACLKIDDGRLQLCASKLCSLPPPTKNTSVSDSTGKKFFRYRRMCDLAQWSLGSLGEGICMGGHRDL